MNRPARTPMRPRQRRLGIAIGALIVALMLLGGSAGFYTDLLWFDELGFGDVFWRQIQTKASLAAVFGAVFAFLLLLNLWIAQKITSPRRFFSVSDQVLERYRATLQPYTRWIVLGGSALLGIFAGTGATSQWRSWLLFRNATTFGRADPVFGNDIGFYVFKLPFYRFLFAWGFSTLIVVTLVVGAAHYLLGGIRAIPRGERFAPEVRAHLSVLAAAIVLLKAWGYRLDQYDLLYSLRGTVTGASYTDLNAQLPALRLLVLTAIIVAVLFIVNAWVRASILPVAGIAILALMSIFAGGVYPAFVQRVRVAPVERVREAPFIARNIEHTREAFGIDSDTVKVKSFPASGRIDREIVEANRPTVDNIRLWSPDVLAKVYLQLQRIRQYYEFLDVDVDRYTINGKRTQVMLSPREMAQADLAAEAQTWLNRHLYYTHGFGVVASQVNKVGPEGEPDFIIGDIPPQSDVKDLAIKEPRVYFGESEETPFAVVRTGIRELDYPTSGEDVEETTYAGKGGVELSGFLRRFAFAWRFRDPNLVLSGAIKPESRIMFRRKITSRVQGVAPFLKFDGDPYIAIVDGRLTWIIDAYTTTDMYPYSQRIALDGPTQGSLRGGANYIRNSVKATVDAADGTVTLYRWDESDPVARAWNDAFGGIMRPRSEMSKDLVSHVRYPEDLFKIQSDRYTIYHMTEPDAFYSKEDAWAVPVDPTATQAFPPYYLVMTLPGEKSPEFVLIRPYTPRNRQNMIAWIAARSDPEHYGQLIAFVFPKQRVVAGPQQVQARINQDPVVAPQITLLDQRGSRVIYGNLLVIPIAESLLYVQPLYLQGEGSELPELRRVVVVAGDLVRMAPTLEEALSAVVTGRRPSPGEGGPSPPTATVAQELERALRHFTAAQAALRDGDLARYQRELQAAEAAVRRAQEASTPARR